METVSVLRFVLAFAFVLGLLGLFAWGLKRWGDPQKVMKRMRAGRRMQVSETLYLDNRRKLVLVRRDDTEHLILLSPSSEAVIETGLKAPMMNADHPDKAHDAKP
jgi:flagellar protein FliO/FliZ